MIINSLLSSLLVEIMRESWHPEEKKHAAKRASVLEIKEWIDHNYAESITLDDLASRFFINKYYLTKSFKAQFGTTINSYLNTVRISHAKSLLRFTDKTLDEIGEAVGISSACYFSQVFSAIEGVSPSTYRKQW
jgi:YesN/AraC family two-component response regulator